MLAHAAMLFETVGLELPGPAWAVVRVFAPFRIPGLMFLSGMLVDRSLRKSFREFALGKVYFLYWPFLLWSVLTLAAEQRLTMINLVKVPVTSPTVMWYLLFLFIYYFVAFGLNRYRISFLAVAIACLAISPFLPEWQRISRFAYLQGVFLLGSVLRNYMIQPRMYGALMSRTEEGRRATSLPFIDTHERLLTFAAMLVVVAGATASLCGFEIKYQTLCVACPIAFVFLGARIAEMLPRNTFHEFVQWVGRNSIVFYAVHFSAQSILLRLLQANGISDSWLVLLLLCAVCFPAEIVLQLLRDRFALVAFMFDLAAFHRHKPLRTNTFAADS